MSDLINIEPLREKTTALLEFLGQQDMSNAECQLVMMMVMDFFRLQATRDVLIGGHNA